MLGADPEANADRLRPVRAAAPSRSDGASRGRGVTDDPARSRSPRARRARSPSASRARPSATAGVGWALGSRSAGWCSQVVGAVFYAGASRLRWLRRHRLGVRVRGPCWRDRHRAVRRCAAGGAGPVADPGVGHAARRAWPSPPRPGAGSWRDDLGLRPGAGGSWPRSVAGAGVGAQLGSASSTSCSGSTPTDPAHQLHRARASGVAGLIGCSLLLAVCAPVVEELLFRGLLQGGLDRRRCPRAAAVVITAALFAGAHLQAVQFPGLFVAGLVFGGLALRSGRLGPAIVRPHDVQRHHRDRPGGRRPDRGRRRAGADGAAQGELLRTAVATSPRCRCDSVTGLRSRPRSDDDLRPELVATVTGTCRRERAENSMMQRRVQDAESGCATDARATSSTSRCTCAAKRCTMTSCSSCDRRTWQPQRREPRSLRSLLDDIKAAQPLRKAS